MDDKKLKQVFVDLLNRQKATSSQTQQYWLELQAAYRDPGRYYHNMEHLVHLYKELLGVKTLIADWDSLLLALFYQDVVYDIASTTNEEDSADLAERVLVSIKCDQNQIYLVRAHIMATKSHSISSQMDTLYFTDADLSILGANEKIYDVYTRQIRKEYERYPDTLYTAGRKRVLLHFLNMDRIFKTDYFFQKYEQAARENLGRELATPI